MRRALRSYRSDTVRLWNTANAVHARMTRNTSRYPSCARRDRPDRSRPAKDGGESHPAAPFSTISPRPFSLFGSSGTGFPGWRPEEEGCARTIAPSGRGLGKNSPASFFPLILGRMDCPFCKISSMRRVLAGGKEIDRCLSCGALWFDCGEIRELTDGRLAA